jgi:HAD superfamily hydrolase (TIGR01509 family)
MLIIFDCDGVLVDSEIISARVEAAMLTKVGYPITPEELAIRFAGLTARRIVELVEDELGRALPETLMQEAEEETDRRLAAEVAALAGVDEMLDRLHLPRCICSNSSSARLKMTLERAGLYDRFHPHIFSAVELENCRPKPAPDVFLYAALAFDTDPHETIVIEDSVHGVRGAKAAGMKVIGFTGASHTWPGHSDALTEAGADTVIKRLAEVPAMVQALASWEGLP